MFRRSLDSDKANFKDSSYLYNHVVNIEIIKDAAEDRLITDYDPGIKERIKNYSLHYGTLTMTFIWENRNDLDLHVEGPCGTRS